MKQLFTGTVGMTVTLAGALLALSGAYDWGLFLVGVLVLGLLALETLQHARAPLLHKQVIEVRSGQGQRS